MNSNYKKNRYNDEKSVSLASEKPLLKRVKKETKWNKRIEGSQKKKRNHYFLVVPLLAARA